MDEIRDEYNNENKLSQFEYLLQNHHIKTVFLMIVVHACEKRVQVLDVIPASYEKIGNQKFVSRAEISGEGQNIHLLVSGTTCIIMPLFCGASSLSLSVANSSSRIVCVWCPMNGFPSFVTELYFTSGLAIVISSIGLSRSGEYFDWILSFMCVFGTHTFVSPTKEKYATSTPKQQWQ